MQVTLASLIPVSPWPQPFSCPLFCMQLLKHVANAMQRAEGFVLERALVIYSRVYLFPGWFPTVLVWAESSKLCWDTMLLLLF